MAYYYKYSFISPNGIYAIVQEELKSYFDTGAIDSLMFPTYVDKCLRKLGRSSYPIKEKVLEIEDFTARLPDNFHAVREAWLCTEVTGYPYQTANSFYSQTDDPTTILISAITTDSTGCGNPNCNDPNCDGSCVPTLIQPVYKTNKQMTRSFRREYLLKPGNISASTNCSVEYTSAWQFYTDNPLLNEFAPGDSGYDSFDIRDNKFVVNFRDGIVHLIFYADETDETGNQMIPDNYRIMEYIEKFIKYKMFETLTNQVNDETFNQLRQKMMDAKVECDEAYILAEIEIKKSTMFEKQRQLKSDLKRFAMYELPNRTYRYGWRRYN